MNPMLCCHSVELHRVTSVSIYTCVTLDFTVPANAWTLLVLQNGDLQYYSHATELHESRSNIDGFLSLC